MTTKASPPQAKLIAAILRYGGYRVPGSKVFSGGRHVIRPVTITACQQRDWVIRDNVRGKALWSVTTKGRIAVDVSPVGPDGVGGWVHTDGRTYLHDPSTSAYKRYDAMVPGDVIDWAARAAVEVVRVNEPYPEQTGPLAGQRWRAHWCRRLSDGAEGYVPFGPDGEAPVRLTPVPAGAR